MPLIEKWKVQKSSGICAGTGKKLEQGEEYYAALIETEDGFERRDFSCEYWRDKQPQVYSYWKTNIPVAGQKKKLFVDDGVIINFFERLAEETDTIKLNFRFVLALILMRKRLLKYEDSIRKGEQEIWKMRFVREKKIHEVVNPHLQDEQIEEVSRQLSSILQGDFA